MNDCTLIRYARLYARYLGALKWYGSIARYLPKSFFIEKAADGEYTIESANKVINRISKDKELRRQITTFLRFQENQKKPT